VWLECGYVIDDVLQGAKSLWKPSALRPSILVVTTATCWALIAILQYLLSKSQRKCGILFASNINALPLSQTFLFRYLSTIIAVMFSIFWTWIDLETKRLETYYQLSKEGGALGKDSLLLQYSFNPVPLVPIKALKDRQVNLPTARTVLGTFFLLY
jgi:hypothetical protein